MDNNLTDRGIWSERWHDLKLAPVPHHPIYKPYLPDIPDTAKFIEIGGFPGYNAGFFYKHICRDVSILDFYIDMEIIRKLERENGIPEGTIKVIESDFFAISPVFEEKFDVVFSIGFIEHFQDTEDVIARHVKLLTKGGRLVILLPNFRGLNGLLQYLFDKENLSIHNLESMKPDGLRKACEHLGLKDIKVGYTRKPMLWLQAKNTVGNRIGRSVVKGCSYFLKMFPIKGRIMSPYIYVIACK